MANIELDGSNKKIKVDSGDLTLDIPGDIILDADGGDVTFADGGTNIASLTNSSSSLVIESKVSDNDIIFKVNDGGSSTEVARFDGDVSALKIASGKKLMLGAAEEYISGDGTDITFAVGSSGDINIPANIGMTFGDDGEKIEGDGTDLTISGNNINLTAVADVVIPNDVGIQFGGASEKIEGDGTDMTISANNLTVDAAADITLDAGGNNFKFSSGGTQVLDIANSSSNVIIKPTVDAKDVIFQQYDGNEVMRINDSRKLQFYDDGGESITSDGSKLIIESGGTTFNLPSSDGSADQFLKTNGSGTLSFADAGGGAFVLVGSASGSSDVGSVDINGCFSATYENYLITFRIGNSGDEREINFRFKNTSNAALTGYAYRWGYNTNNPDQSGNNAAGSATSSTTGNNYDRFQLADAAENDVAYPTVGNLFIFSPMSSSISTYYLGEWFHYRDSVHYYINSGGGMYDANTQIAGINIYPSANYIDDYRINVYGIKDS